MICSSRQSITNEFVVPHFTDKDKSFTQFTGGKCLCLLVLKSCRVTHVQWVSIV